MSEPDLEALLCVRCRDRARVDGDILCQECTDALSRMTEAEMAADARESAHRTAFRMFVIDPMISSIERGGTE